LLIQTWRARNACKKLQKPKRNFARHPVQLICSEHFDRITDAIVVERKIKGWSRQKKEALTRNDWSAIRLLAKRRADKSKQ